MTEASARGRAIGVDTVVTRFVQREAPDLLNYFIRRSEIREDAADLMSETLLVVWRRVESLPADETEARMWLYGIARRVILSHRRGLRRKQALASRLRGSLALQGSDHDAKEGSEAADAIAQLAAVDREIIRLVHWEGFSLAEVATIMRRRPATIRSRYHRARESLRSALAEGSGRARSDAVDGPLATPRRTDQPG